MKYSLSNDTWDNMELTALQRVIDSGRFTMAGDVEDYERKFATKIGSTYAVMSNSGSSANLLMMAALIYSGRLNRGDEVLVTAVSWSTTYFPVSQMGLSLRFVDIDPETLNVDPVQLEAAVTDRTRAVLAVNLLGNPNDFDAIRRVCDDHGLILMEDNCESLGATYAGSQCGTFGIVGTFSTYYSHHLCTMEGGMSVTDDEELYDYMLCIRSHGWTRHLPDGASIYEKSPEPFYESFNFIMPGFNLRPLEMEAATGVEQLKKMDTLVAQRRENARYFKGAIAKTDFRIQKECGEASWFGFALVLPEDLAGMRNRYVRAMAEAEIETRPIVAGNFARQRALRFVDHTTYGSLSNADYIHENGFFVGNHSAPMIEEIDLLVDTLLRA